MPEVADAFRRFASSYDEVHGAAMLPSHRRAITDIIACRTEALGGQQWCCNHCGALLHVFHSCRNRACPKCHAEQTRAWLEQRREEMLPVRYFHVTVTVPEELRTALRRHQVNGYGALMKAAAAAIIDLGRDPRWIGGTVGVLAVLHTWTQRLIFHPHVHCLVTGGGLSDDGTVWHSAGRTFLFPKSALATLARARFRAGGVGAASWRCSTVPTGENPPTVVPSIRTYDGSLGQRRCSHNQHSGCSRIHRSSVAFIARLSAYTSAVRSLVSGSVIGGSQITRNRAGPRRTGWTGMTGQRKRRANCARAGVVIASRPKNGTARPSFSFWSTSMPSTPPRLRCANASRAPVLPLANIGTSAPIASRRMLWIAASAAGLDAAR